MKRQLPKYVYSDRGYTYFRKDGVSVRLPDLDDDLAAFYQAYAECVAGAKQGATGRTINALIIRFKESKRYKNLAKATVTKYDRILERLSKNVGGKSVKVIKRPDLLNMRDALYPDNPASGDYLISTLSSLFEVGRDIGWLEANPCHGIKKIGGNSETRLPWTEKEVANFHAQGDERASLLLELCIGTGQRVSDVLAMKWEDLHLSNQAATKGMWIVQGKTGAKLFIPFTDRLLAILDKTPRSGPYIMYNLKHPKSQLGYTAARQCVVDIRDAIGVTKTIHDLRHTCAHKLASLGLSTDVIKAITGHHSDDMVRRYANESKQIADANAAIAAVNAANAM